MRFLFNTKNNKELSEFLVLDPQYSPGKNVCFQQQQKLYIPQNVFFLLCKIVRHISLTFTI